MNKIIIGAAIDACAGTVGSADTPDKLQNKEFLNVGLKFDNIQRYSGARDDIEKLASYFTNLASSTKNAVHDGRFPIVVGGDHSCAIGTWSGISSAYLENEQNIGIIWMDAHMDAHTFEDSDTKNVHGMPVAVLLGEGEAKFTNILKQQPKIKPENIILIGIRSYEAAEEERLQRLGVKVYYTEEVNSRGFSAVFNEAWNALDKKVDKIGLSIDLDGFDPEFAPGVGTPVENGINFNHCCAELAKIDINRLAGVEITEGNDHFDASGRTMQCIVEIIQQVTEGKTISHANNRIKSTQARISI
jgi:arginase